MLKVCRTCEKEFESKRKDKSYCSRLCYRRNPEIAKRYSDRTNGYQKSTVESQNAGMTNLNISVIK